MSTCGDRILVVDDEPLIRRNIGLFLADEGLDVAAAGSGEEALAKLREEVFPVLVVDIRLPGIDGNELIRQANRMRPGTRFLVHTGSTNYVLPADFRAIGMTEQQIFRKPLIDMTVLSKAVVRLVRQRDNENDTGIESDIADD